MQPVRLFVFTLYNNMQNNHLRIQNILARSQSVIFRKHNIFICQCCRTFSINYESDCSYAVFSSLNHGERILSLKSSLGFIKYLSSHSLTYCFVFCVLSCKTPIQQHFMEFMYLYIIQYLSKGISYQVLDYHIIETQIHV